MRTRNSHAGFTLIELLVVVVVIAVIVSIGVLSLGTLGDDRMLRREIYRIGSLLEVAQDEAVMQGRDFGLEIMRSGYRFVEYDLSTNQWGELLGDDTFRMRQLPDSVEFDLLLEDKRIVLEEDPAEFDDSDDNDRSLTESYAPHILIFSSGDLTPFELRILRPVADQSLVLKSDLTGAIEIVTDEE